MTPASQSASITYIVERKLGSGSFTRDRRAAAAPARSPSERPRAWTTPLRPARTRTGSSRTSTIAWTAISNEVARSQWTRPRRASPRSTAGSKPDERGDGQLVGDVRRGRHRRRCRRLRPGRRLQRPELRSRCVSGVDATYTVTASTGVDGNLGLNLVDDDSIVDGVGNPLGGVGAGNGDFTGQAYVIDKSGPTNVLSLVAQAPSGSSHFDGSSIVFYRGTGGGAGGTSQLSKRREGCRNRPGVERDIGARRHDGGLDAHGRDRCRRPPGGPYMSNAFYSGPKALPASPPSTSPEPTAREHDDVDPDAAERLRRAGGRRTDGQRPVAASGAGIDERRTSRELPDRRPHGLHRSAEATSGLATSTLVRESAPLSNDVCGTFGRARDDHRLADSEAGRASRPGTATATRSPARTTSATAPRISTIVKVDTSAPSLRQPGADALRHGRLRALPGHGTTVYYNGTRARGAASRSTRPTSPTRETGIQKVELPRRSGATSRAAATTPSSPYQHDLHVDELDRQRHEDRHGDERDHEHEHVDLQPRPRRDGSRRRRAHRQQRRPRTAGGSDEQRHRRQLLDQHGERTTAETQNATQSGLARRQHTRPRVGDPASRTRAEASARRRRSSGTPTQKRARGSRRELLPLHAERYRQRRQHDQHLDDRQGRHDRTEVRQPGPDARGRRTVSPTTREPGRPCTTTGTTGTASSITVDAPNVVDPETGSPASRSRARRASAGGGADASSPLRHDLHVVELERERLADGDRGEHVRQHEHHDASPWCVTSRIRPAARSR